MNNREGNELYLACQEDDEAEISTVVSTLVSKNPSRDLSSSNAHLSETKVHSKKHNRLYGDQEFDKNGSYTIPSDAPRIKVPSDELSLRDVILLDAVALAVMRGGPSTEEKVALLEENNPDFAFLRAHWEDPKMIYYRWRLYSLLQGDSLLTWEEKPFQLERSRYGYVFIPPAPLLSCASSLEKAHESKAPIPSTSWYISRKLLVSDQLFLVLPEEQQDEWKQALRVKIPEFTPLKPKEGGPAISDEDLKRHFEDWFEKSNILTRKDVAAAMVIAIDASHAPHHLLSILLDEQLAIVQASILDAPLQDLSSASDEDMAALQMQCSSAISHCLRTMFLISVLHDVLSNVFKKPFKELPKGKNGAFLTPKEVDEINKYTDEERKEVQKNWQSAVDIVLPTFIEAVFSSFSYALSLTGAISFPDDVDSIPSMDEGTEPIIKLHYQPFKDALLNNKSKFLLSKVYFTALNLLLVLQRRFCSWSSESQNRTIVSHRLAIDLKEKYPFLNLLFGREGYGFWKIPNKNAS